MIGYVFPGQAAQFEGMGIELLERGDMAIKMLDQANEVLGFDLKEVMVNGSLDDLKQTKVTQPAVYVHSIVRLMTTGSVDDIGAVAGHSLGEISALVAAGVLDYAEGLELVRTRAFSMQRACELASGTMAAIVGMDDEKIIDICNGIDEIVLAANFNCPGQTVISGSIKGIDIAVEKLKEAGAKRAIVLQVGGAFHSALMQPAKEELAEKINVLEFKQPKCPVYQNVDAQPYTEAVKIKENLIDQLTSPVK